VSEVAQVLVDAERLVLYAGQGVHYAQAWPELCELAELLAAPVTTSLEGKSAFPETHPLSLGSGGRSIPKTVHDFLQNSDVIFGIGCSFAVTNYGVSMPSGKVIIHATLDPADLNKDAGRVRAHRRRKLTLQALIGEVKDRLGASMRDGHG
jgi:acetolactate synthase-1/2/3 large subunit